MTLSDDELLELSLRSEFMIDFRSLLCFIASSCFGVALLSASPRALFVFCKIMSSFLPVWMPVRLII